MAPLISILIPTKNRYKYLKILIEALSSSENIDFEIVIQDNSDDNASFIEYLNLHSNSSIKYFYSTGHLSVIENSELAVKNSTGVYTCFIGDDDGVLPAIVEFVKWMHDNKIDAAITNVPQYYWPDVVHNIHNFSSQLHFTVPTGAITFLNAEKELINCLHKGGITLGRMPRLYHGIVSRTCLENIRLQCGTYFPGPSPDMANSIALSFFAKRFVHFDFPLIIAGTGYQSTGGAGARKQHIGRIEDIPHLPKSTSIYWDSRIPKIWTGQTIWAESAIKAINALGRSDLESEFNFNYLYASFLVFHPNQSKYIYKYLKSIRILPVLLFIFTLIAIRAKYYMLNKIVYKTHFFRKMSLNEIINIQCAIQKLTLQFKYNPNEW